jgi:3-oxoadipate enol-lactonase
MAGGTCSQFGDISGVLNGNLLDLLFTPDYIESNRHALEVFFKETSPFHSQGEALQRQLQAFATHNTCDTLAKIKAPTLILTGDRDIAIPPVNSDTLVNKIPNAKLKVIANAAHAFPYSHGDITANLIHTFLQ